MNDAVIALEPAFAAQQLVLLGRIGVAHGDAFAATAQQLLDAGVAEDFRQRRVDAHEAAADVHPVESFDGVVEHRLEAGQVFHRPLVRFESIFLHPLDTVGEGERNADSAQQEADRR